MLSVQYNSTRTFLDMLAYLPLIIITGGLKFESLFLFLLWQDLFILIPIDIRPCKYFRHTLKIAWNSSQLQLCFFYCPSVKCFIYKIINCCLYEFHVLFIFTWTHTSLPNIVYGTNASWGVKWISSIPAVMFIIIA